MRNPKITKSNEVLYYSVTGFDLEGRFECLRRFSDFESLRNAWKERLAGLFIPQLPAKKGFGSQVDLSERCSCLEEFLRKVYKLQYLVNSDEFTYFARYESNEDISKVIDKLPPQSLIMLTFRIKKANPSIQYKLHKTVKLQMRQAIEQCRSFAQAHLQTMQLTKKVFKKFASEQDVYMTACNGVVKSLIKFEINHLDNKLDAEELDAQNQSVLI